MKQVNLLLMSAAMTLAACGGTKDAGQAGAPLIERSDIQIEGKRMTPEALWAMGRIGGVAVSPDEKQFLAVGGERITFDVTIILRQLLASATIRIHFPQLAAATFIGKERQFSATLYPAHFIFLPGSAGDLLVARSICFHHEYFAVTLVFRYTVVSHRVGNLLFIGGKPNKVPRISIPISLKQRVSSLPT